MHLRLASGLVIKDEDGIEVPTLDDAVREARLALSEMARRATAQHQFPEVLTILIEDRRSGTTQTVELGSPSAE